MRLLIRKLDENDLSKRVAYMSLPEIYTQMPVPHPVSLEQTKVWFNDLPKENRHRIDFSVTNLLGEVIGFCGIGTVNYKDKNANFYIFLDPQKASHGFGSRIMKWLINYGFITYDLNRIYCFTIASNKGANKFYEKLGMKFEGCLRQHLFHLTQYVDRNCYGILRHEWIDREWSQRDQINNEL